MTRTRALWAALVLVAATVAGCGDTRAPVTTAGAEQAASSSSTTHPPSQVAAPADEVPRQPPTTTTTQPPPTTTTTEAPVQALHAQPPPTPSSSGACPAHGDPGLDACWDQLAGCESGGNWAANTGNGYYGGIQFSLSSWQSVGGSGYPHEHSRAEQITRGRMLHASGGWRHWPACSRSFGWI